MKNGSLRTSRTIQFSLRFQFIVRTGLRKEKRWRCMFSHKQYLVYGCELWMWILQTYPSDLKHLLIKCRRICPESFQLCSWLRFTSHHRQIHTVLWGNFTASSPNLRRHTLTDSSLSPPILNFRSFTNRNENRRSQLHKMYSAGHEKQRKKYRTTLTLDWDIQEFTIWSRWICHSCQRLHTVTYSHTSHTVC